jgi:hypothetical protein
MQQQKLKNQMTNMSKQQTAVDWLIQQINGMGLKDIGIDIPKGMIQQAKEMEKQQHSETFKESRLATIFEYGEPPVWENFEQYYNKTYGTE